jgi:hypothetical protein
VEHDGKIKKDLDAKLTSALREQKFVAVVIDMPALAYPPFLKKIERCHEPERAVVKGDWSFGPINFKRLEARPIPCIYLPR